MVAPMLISLFQKFVVKRENVAHQAKLKLLNIFLVPLATHKFLPSFQKVFRRNDIIICMTQPLKSPPQRVLPGVLEKIKSAYLLWHKLHIILPQVNRYTLGNKIDKLFIEIIEYIATAFFLSKGEKLPYMRLAIRKLDTLKILLLVLWETQSIETRKYIALSLLLDEIGKMLGGWHNKLEKENSPTEAGEK